MSKATFVFVLGLFLIVLPYLGIPSVWKNYIYLALGIVLILVGYALRRTQYFNEINQGNGHLASDTFVETTQNLFAEVKVE